MMKKHVAGDSLDYFSGFGKPVKISRASPRAIFHEEKSIKSKDSYKRHRHLIEIGIFAAAIFVNMLLVANTDLPSSKFRFFDYVLILFSFIPLILVISTKFYSLLLFNRIYKNGFLKKQDKTNLRAFEKIEWTDVPLYFNFKHANIIRGMSTSSNLRYFYKFSVIPVGGKEFMKQSGLKSSLIKLYGALNLKEKFYWEKSKDGLWKVSFSSGVFEPFPGEMGESTGSSSGVSVLRNILRASFSGVRFSPLKGRARNYFYFFGKEMVNLFSIPKLIAADVGLSVPVEVHSPATMRNDIVLGKVIEAESRQQTINAGLCFDHFKGGLAIIGGTPIERIALMKNILSHSFPFSLVIIDDHDDYPKPGARRFVPGKNLALNPMIPSFYHGVPISDLYLQSRNHVELLTTILSMLSGWRLIEENTFLKEMQVSLEISTRIKGMIPDVSQLFLEVPVDTINSGGAFSPAFSRDASAITKRVQEDIDRYFSGWNKPFFSIHDHPRFEAQMFDKKNIIFDLSCIHGIEKKLIKALLITKIIEIVEFSSMHGSKIPVLLVIPEIDKLFHDETVQIRKNNFFYNFSKFFNMMAAKNVHFLVSCQHPSNIPSSILQRFSTMVTFRQVEKMDVDITSRLLHLEDEQLYERSRKASYQRKFLSQMDDGVAYLKRPDFNSVFLMKVNINDAMKLFKKVKPSRTRKREISFSRTRKDSLLDFILGSFRKFKGLVLKFLINMKSIDSLGIKKSALIEIWASVIAKSLKERGEVLDEREKLIEKRSKVFAEEIFKKLFENGLLMHSEYNPTGLKDDMMIKLSSGGFQLIQFQEDNNNEENISDSLRKKILKMKNSFARLQEAGQHGSPDAFMNLISSIKNVVQAIQASEPIIRKKLDERALMNSLSKINQVIDVSPSNVYDSIKDLVITLESVVKGIEV
ncbi:MAG: hypothetical protein ACTSVI_01085 [Promethearchaeota archaeon]